MTSRSMSELPRSEERTARPVRPDVPDGQCWLTPTAAIGIHPCSNEFCQQSPRFFCTKEQNQTWCAPALGVTTNDSGVVNPRPAKASDTSAETAEAREAS